MPPPRPRHFDHGDHVDTTPPDHFDLTPPDHADLPLPDHVDLTPPDHVDLLPDHVDLRGPDHVDFAPPEHVDLGSAPDLSEILGAIAALTRRVDTLTQQLSNVGGQLLQLQHLVAMGHQPTLLSLQSVMNAATRHYRELTDTVARHARDHAAHREETTTRYAAAIGEVGDAAADAQAALHAVQQALRTRIQAARARL